MRKIACLVLAYVLVFSLASCGKVKLYENEVAATDFYDGLSRLMDLTDTERFYKRSMEATGEISTKTTTETIYTANNRLMTKKATSGELKIQYNKNAEMGTTVFNGKSITSSESDRTMEVQRIDTVYVLSGRNFYQYDDLTKTYTVTEPDENDETGAYRSRVYQKTALSVKDAVEDYFGSQIRYSYLADEELWRIIEYADEFDIELSDMYQVISRLSSSGSVNRNGAFDILDKSTRSDIRNMLKEMDRNNTNDSKLTYYIDEDLYTVKHHFQTDNREDQYAEYDLTETTDVVVQVTAEGEKLHIVRHTTTASTYIYDDHRKLITTEEEWSLDIAFIDEVPVVEPDRSEYVDLTPRPKDDEQPY